MSCPLSRRDPQGPDAGMWSKVTIWLAAEAAVLAPLGRPAAYLAAGQDEAQDDVEGQCSDVSYDSHSEDEVEGEHHVA